MVTKKGKGKSKQTKGRESGTKGLEGNSGDNPRIEKGAGLVKVKPVQYVGLDTETQDGKAILICTPEHSCTPSTWGDCWAFLSKYSSDYVVWNVSYDARALLAYLPGTVLKRIQEKGGASYHDWRIRYMGRKYLRIKKGKKAVCLWDAYPYYDSGLDDAAEKWLDEGKVRIPKSWLPKMSWALKRYPDKVITYCKRDAGLTERLWRNIEKQFLQLGIAPWRAASPAALALRGFPESFDFSSVPEYVDRNFQQSYYGGRIEIFQRGNVGKTWYYDIHSAYPSALQTLLDPRGGCDVKASSSGPHPDAIYGSYWVTVKVHPDTVICPVPVRSVDGPLLYPSGIFSTWVDLDTLRLLIKYNFDHEIKGGCEILNGRHERLFPDLEPYYQMRRDDPSVSLAVKKLLNSLYGKCAETRPLKVKCGKHIPRNAIYRDGAFVFPMDIPTKHTCFAVAGACTGRIRARLYDLMLQKPEKIVSCHTDGIISTSPLDLKLGEKLGEWGLDRVADETIIIGCGIYLFREGDKWTERQRGLHLDKSLLTLRNRRMSTGEFRILHARTLAEAQRTGWQRLNALEYIRKDIDANMDQKRVWPREWRSFRAVFRDRMVSHSRIIVTDDVRRAARRDRKKSRK